MKLLLLPLLLTAFINVGIAQSDPVPQGGVTYALPQSAVEAELSGTISVAVRVDETGKPTTAVLTTGPLWPCGASVPTKAIEDLSVELSQAMMKLQFKPAMQDGKAVAKDVLLKLTLKNPKLAPQIVIDPATGKPKPVQISGGVLNGKAKSMPRPSYPAAARARGESGGVAVQVLIDENGKVVRAGGVQGAPLLRMAAREAACDAKFDPTRLSGNPVKVSGVLTYNFVP